MEIPIRLEPKTSVRTWMVSNTRSVVTNAHPTPLPIDNAVNRIGRGDRNTPISRTRMATSEMVPNKDTSDWARFAPSAAKIGRPVTSNSTLS